LDGQAGKGRGTGKKSRFRGTCEPARLPRSVPSSDTAPQVFQAQPESLGKKRRTPHHHRGESVSSISYLPQTFTTLFFLAASLLLGLIR
jgi:hypothetical protein